MDITFTTKQSHHAIEVAAELFKKRRFFLPRGVSTAKPLPYLSPKVFEYIYRLNDLFEDEYFFTAKNAEAKLRKLELDYGINAPKLKDSQAVAECNRYTGGLDIVAIVPLSRLLFQIGELDIRVAQELFEFHYPDSARGYMSRNHLLALESTFSDFGKNLLEELSQYLKDTPTRDKVLVVLNTRFEPSAANDDFMQGKLDGLITYPHLASWVLYKNALRGIRLSDLNITIFNSSRSGHISLRCDSVGPRLTPDQEHGYDCKIAFATIL